MSMMAPTVSGLDPFLCCSAIQKAVRRSDERTAVGFALEMGLSSQSYFTMAANRIRVMMHEDIGPSDPILWAQGRMALNDAIDLYAAKRQDWVLCITNALVCMCRARKSRLCLDLYTVAKDDVLRKKLKVPDAAYDLHTVEGKKMGRGHEHFFNEGQVLVQPVLDRDSENMYGENPYAAESRKTWQTGSTKYGNGSNPAPRELSDSPSDISSGEAARKAKSTGYKAPGGDPMNPQAADETKTVPRKATELF